ncbi:MAG: NTP transferase domain-containing protein, partial [Pseudomonadota bacterium]
PGWLVLPGSMLRVHPATLRRLADDLAAHSLVFPEYKGLRGYPVGFGPEFFSELMALQLHERSTQRLLARYPGHAVEVDDPEVLCHDWEATAAGSLPARHLIDGFHTYQRQ